MVLLSFKVKIRQAVLYFLFLNLFWMGFHQRVLLRHWDCLGRGVGDVDRSVGVVVASLELYT